MRVHCHTCSGASICFNTTTCYSIATQHQRQPGYSRNMIKLKINAPLLCSCFALRACACDFVTPRLKLNVGPPFATKLSQYVRNHGAVPKISWGDHTITISGLVGKPVTLTMDEIVALPSVTIPITLVCAGNRRKEENMLKKSIGFNWGPCSTSCSYWTGVRLRDLLIYAGVKVSQVLRGLTRPGSFMMMCELVCVQGRGTECETMAGFDRAGTGSSHSHTHGVGGKCCCLWALSQFESESVVFARLLVPSCGISGGARAV